MSIWKEGGSRSSLTYPPPPPRENLKLCLRPPIPQANLDFTWNPPPPPEKISDSLYRICSETNQTIFYQAVSHTKTWIWQRWINLTWQMSWQFITNIKTLKTHKHEISSILKMKIKIKTIIIMEDNLTIWTRKTCITCMLSIYWPCVRYKRFQKYILQKCFPSKHGAIWFQGTSLHTLYKEHASNE